MTQGGADVKTLREGRRVEHVREQEGGDVCELGDTVGVRVLEQGREED